MPTSDDDGPTSLEVIPVGGLPEVQAGDDLATLLLAALRVPLEAADVLVLAHKVVSKAEGRVVALDSVSPSARAIELATPWDKDPRHVEVILRETKALVRAERGVLISRTHHGFVCANAGVDASNAGASGALVLLPLDPDASARRLRAALPARPAIIITDSFGRAWRHGQVDIAIGVAGLAPLEDWRGHADADGRVMQASWVAVADQVAAAADLVRTKNGSSPAALVRGLGRYVTVSDGPGAAALLRPPEEDLMT